MNDCKSLDELLMLYNEYPDSQQALHPEFTKKRHQLMLQNKDSKIIAQQKILNNGTSNS